MFFDDEAGPIFRPPSEANSFILRVTVGCSHNKCTYCNMYRSVDFHVKSPEDIAKQINAALIYKNNIRRIFLSDGDALILATDRLLDILQELYAKFPKLQRVSSYAGPKAILTKSPEELKALRLAGLKLLYYGMETGDNDLLTKVKKGVTADEAIEAGCKIREAGIKLSMMVIIGLAGKKGTKEHALNTAKAVNIIKPDMLSALTLMLYRGSELKAQYEKGEFFPLNPSEIMQELYDILEEIHLPEGTHCLFRSNHISNYLSLAGTLPKDKNRLMLEVKEASATLQNMSDYDPYNDVETY